MLHKMNRERKLIALKLNSHKTYKMVLKLEKYKNTTNTNNNFI